MVRAPAPVLGVRLRAERETGGKPPTPERATHRISCELKHDFRLVGLDDTLVLRYCRSRQREVTLRSGMRKRDFHHVRTYLT